MNISELSTEENINEFTQKIAQKTNSAQSQWFFFTVIFSPFYIKCKSPGWSILKDLIWPVLLRDLSKFVTGKKLAEWHNLGPRSECGTDCFNEALRWLMSSFVCAHGSQAGLRCVPAWLHRWQLEVATVSKPRWTHFASQGRDFSSKDDTEWLFLLI